MRGGLCHHPRGVQERFPRDQDLVDLGIESYLGVPLLDGDGNVLGHLAVFDERPMPAEPRLLFIFRIFATRAGRRARTAEGREATGRERAPLSRSLRRGAERLRVARHETCELMSVNRRAAQLLGYSAAELVGSNISTYFAETPSGRAQGRASICTRVRRRRRFPGSSWRCGGATAARSGSASGCGRLRGVDGSVQADPFDLGRHHRPRARRGRPCPTAASRTSTFSKRSSPSTTSRRSSAAARL